MAQKEIRYGEATFPLSYEILNPSAPRDILFLHGWGSNKEIMKQAFGRSFADFRHLYLDLPGFGGTPNELVLATRDYAKITQAFLSEVGFKGDFIAGHSFGGKVATLLSPQNLILLSSAGILLPKSLKIKSKIALAKIAKPLLRGVLTERLRSEDAKGMPQNMYETFKNVVDEDFSPHFRESRSLGFLFWGKEDRATPLECGCKIASLMPRATLFPLEGDHYFFLNQATLIEGIVKKGIALKTYHFKITGKVQGVGYRKFTQRVAQEMGLKGHVRNMEDGSVEALCTLEESQYEPFIKALHQGPLRSKVEAIEASEVESRPLEGFEILY
ncbi:alpha/beta fold hydrolase [Wolinella succinogenes]|uniref:alpha/beta fold hydrolase n=1 Tax=Wolinella succinogenes TaxID=844 RepID=UPI0030B8EF4F